MLRLVQHLHLLVPALRSSALRPEEEALRAALEDVDADVRRPGGAGPGRLRGKLNELWALVGTLIAARERNREEGGVGWAVVDEEGLAQIAAVRGLFTASWKVGVLMRDFRFWQTNKTG